MSKIYSAEQYIKNLESFKTYINKIKPTDDFEKVKDKLIDAINILRFYIADLKLSTDRDAGYTEHDTMLETFYNTLTKSTSIDDLSMITPLINLLNTEQFKNLRGYHLSDDADDLEYNNAQGFLLNPSYVELLRESISNNKITLFQPECYSGEIAYNFCKEHEDVAYGQVSEYNSRQAREYLHRVIRGPLKGSFITNNYFDVMMLLPPVGYIEKKDPMGTLIEPIERITIKNTIKYVRPGGVLMITLPYTRVLPSLALYLSKALSNVEVVRVPDDKMKRVTIIGTKNSKVNVSDNDIYQRLRLLDYDNDTISINELSEKSYSIPTEELTLEYFRGSKLDVADVLEACQDNMIKSYLINQTQPLVIKDQSPLLPFNIGQVGLVLTSGCLDGVVEEMDGINHVIKGMTTKVTTTTNEDLEDNKIKSTETISNQVKINVFTADGEFIQLG